MKLQIPSFELIRVLVIGDVMLDRYWSGDTSRISPEAPVPIVHVKNCDERPGGAGNVALNIAALGAKVDLLSFCGDDEEGILLEKKLSQAGVNCYLCKLPKSRTVTKLRILSLHQQLIRLDFEEALYPVDDDYLKQLFEQRITHCDVVIISDYAKGCLTEIQHFIQCAQKANKPVFVDPKRKDFMAYYGATVLTPNLREFESVAGKCENEHALLTKGKQLLKKYNFKGLLVTRGEAGMILIQENQPELSLQAFAKQVYDVTGAGDTAIACLALTFAVQRDLVCSAQLANIAASIVVGKLGAATVSRAELRRAMQTQQSAFRRGIVTEEALKINVADAKANNEKIVMTGGCFDILHAGHVAYLEQAKGLGDRLIVAVNDDNSITSLKGSGRPINKLAHRMAVLAGLSAVDWVVALSDITPERLIQRILPDIWVKGNDYQVNDLPEAKTVHAYGGQIKLIDFVKGCSTSAMISRIQEQERESL
ncbi:bifunctional D-glycero-beta-D-manno-heptose-7-phosphate kinase/D-glycero-beta-D-manno-heptose 1-phosphate adenylyltransferase HldE [Rickettsiella grylli]|uniref:Bifunctional protein HldE n=1 Tax=Rickettsiella grylli TaxID=59196 RepID=A8PQE0_9COXI|nr:bifunctional D-glycero-beta-D-manno-heptose-7-phosphate kinase/D-glycero-beta-D-manno-heptose 1-phosphate adenylyltransferase HldE [Rickettsiella grylli]EDP45995.1 bifunctional protein HldE [Rickettsiella grylli]